MCVHLKLFYIKRWVLEVKKTGYSRTEKTWGKTSEDAFMEETEEKAPAGVDEMKPERCQRSSGSLQYQRKQGIGEFYRRTGHSVKCQIKENGHLITSMSNENVINDHWRELFQ